MRRSGTSALQRSPAGSAGAGAPSPSTARSRPSASRLTASTGWAAAYGVTGATTGAITVFVSHRFSTVRMADLIIVVQDGRVVEMGDHASLAANGGLYAELFSLQAQAYR